MSDAENKRSGPLSGYTVLEMGSTVAGPFCGRLLADFGAEVIKVEPETGDAVRAMGMRDEETSLYASSIFRNKKLISVDLRTEEGRAVVRRIATRVDIIVENFRPGTLEKWGLGYDDLKEENPGLVMVRISGYGQDGPYSDRAGYGIVCESVSGLRELNGDPDRPPPRIAISLTDYITGLYAAFGAVMAINERNFTKKGQVVDAALYESAFSFNEPHVPAFSRLGFVATRTGSRLANNTPNNLYCAKDGRYIHIAAGAQSVFTRLVNIMGQPELLDDPRFSTALARNENHEAIDEIVGAWTATLPLEECEQLLIDNKVPGARIYNMRDIFSDPQYIARDMLVETDGEDGKPVTLAGIVPRMSVNPGRIRWGGRKVGADTNDVLRDVAGLEDSEIEELKGKGVVYAAMPKDGAAE
ncbi:MAG: CoA transferase [Rhodospirillales bacterium]|nr:CoA transferase [Rhodospirillales bacterium]